jgi:hypothetical protein
MVTHNSEISAPEALSGLGDASCVPLPGPGIIGRWGDVLLVVADTDIATTSALIAQCEAVATGAGDGRALSRRLASLLTASDELMPPFAAAAPVETGLAVFIHGSASVTVGDDFELSGDTSLSWVDRLIPWPVTTLRIQVADSTEPLEGPFDLRHGVIPGSGLTLSAMPHHARAMPLPAAAGEPAEGSARLAPAGAAPEDVQATPPLDRWPGQVAQSPFESVVLVSEPADEEEEASWPALPLATEMPDKHTHHTGYSVQGVYCKNGHFNDPRGLFCAVCGINMVQQTPILAKGPRPPLGVLLLDDGSAYQLDDDYMLGRDPTHDDDVRSGRLRGIVLHDDSKSVSRAHARIELLQWDVVVIDNSSANGTYVAADSDSTWTPLAPGAPHVLQSGSRLRLGSCTLVFNAYRGE